MKRLAGGCALVIALLVTIVLPAYAASVTIGSTDATRRNTFNPATVEINPNESVTWSYPATGHGTAPHTVTPDNQAMWGDGGSGELLPGTQYEKTFATPGEYRYHCSFHGGPNGVGMSGTVVVRSAEPPPPPVVASPSPSPPPPPPPPSPSPSPSPSPEPSPTEEATETVMEEESPTSTVTTQAFEDIDDESDEGGMSTPLKIALGAMGLAGVAGGALYWMHRSSRAGPDIAG